LSDERENRRNDDFAAQAHKPQAGLASEFFEFLRDNKKWWLAPIVISILGLGLLVLLGGTAAAPFIYTLF
jgi:predicted cobalt transporter CbtA